MTREKARKFALERHGDQKYGDHPYSVHLDDVSDIAKTYGECAQILAYLHDVVEDTRTTLEEIELEFGSFVSVCVAILTDENGSNRKQRKARTYAKMARVKGKQELALVVKAADRLANLRACSHHNNAQKLSMYKAEHPAFKQSVHRENLCDALWIQMDEIINS